MIEFVLLAVGAVVGAFLRYIMVASPTNHRGVAVNVLAVNMIGSFILGLFSVLAIAFNLNSNYTLLVATGFCGAFTTMSSFALGNQQPHGQQPLHPGSTKHFSQRRLIFRRGYRRQKWSANKSWQGDLDAAENVERHNQNQKETTK